MSLYLDASVIVPLFVQETHSDAIAGWIEQVEEPLLVSDLAASEFASALSRMVRKGELTEAALPSRHLAFEDWRWELTTPVENWSADIRAAARLVRSPFPRLLTPDAIHLATCDRLGAVLVSNDEALREVAAREGVPTLSVV